MSAHPPHRGAWLLRRLLRAAVAAAVVFALAALHLALYPRACAWPHAGGGTTVVLRVLLLADPQMMGDYHAQSQGRLGELDIAFNDAYFRHVVRSLVWWLRPMYTVALGDLLSSENLGRAEFDRRVHRFNHAFQAAREQSVLVSLPGNHDIGYGSVVDRARVSRFEDAFGGPVNRVLRDGGHLLVVLNSMVVDECRDDAMRQQTLDFVDEVAAMRTAQDMPTVLFTHIPLHKPAGVCADAPTISRNRAGHVEQQNMLSPAATQRLLDKLRPRFVFTGHDHEGCRFTHSIAAAPDGSPTTEAHEVTVRSMMAEFGGHSVLFQISRDASGAFVYETSTCAFATHVTVKFVLAALVLSLGAVLVLVLARWRSTTGTGKQYGLS